jgi:hypothetical protein
MANDTSIALYPKHTGCQHFIDNGKITEISDL